MPRAARLVLAVLAVCLSSTMIGAQEPPPNRPVDPDKARRGLVFLRQLQLREIVKRPEFENLYRVWDGEDAEKVKNASAKLRQKLAYARYGFVDAPYPNDGLPMGLVYDRKTQGVHLNCLLCHGGAIRGISYPGLPNQRMDLATFLEDVEIFKKCPPPRDIGTCPQQRPTEDTGDDSRARGGSNAWVKESQLMQLRDRDLNLLPRERIRITPLENFDTTPPPFWHGRKKHGFYHTNFARRGPRPPMLAALYDLRRDGNGIKKLVPDFENVLMWFDSLRAPKYPGSIDRKLADSGRKVFENVCSRCHGTYGETWEFPNREVSIASVGTDPVNQSGKRILIGNYFNSWFNDFGKIDSLESLQRESYLAPPLDGIWASAPYLHNGSVPTLYHMLNPKERPRIWKVVDYDGYDEARVGLSIQPFETIPGFPMTTSERRRYFDTSVHGQGNNGHPFADDLTIDEKTAVLEYLKTL